MKTSTDLVRDMVEMVKQHNDVVTFSRTDGHCVKVYYGPVFDGYYHDEGDYLGRGFVVSYSDRKGADVHIFRHDGDGSTTNIPNGGFIYDDIDLLVEDIVDFLGVGANEQTA